ncbi:MAG: DUF4080 domain-containing protein [Treponema sp.]|nr:DUF4080 domain-containing protein [Candidatus Treponema equifaecale]
MKTLICTTLLVETSPQGLPLGAACIASAIKNSPLTKETFSVELIDFSLEEQEIVLARQNSGEHAVSAVIAQKLAQKKPDYVCFSVYVWNRLILEGAASELKKLLPDCICIAGGPEVTAGPDSFSIFDFTTAGQGELATCQLLSEIEKGNVKIAADVKISDTPVQGVFGKVAALDSSTSNIHFNRAIPCPVEQCPSPYLDGTIDPAKYGGALWELARGCPFKCSYCYESKGEKKIAYFPMERLEKEIELFAKKKIPQVFVLDPTYNANKERAIKMLKTIEKKAPGMFFYFEARAEFIDRELASAFARIPCALQIGLQSADPEVLKNVHRTLDKKKFIKNIGYLNEAGVTFGFDLIYGLPGDTFRGFCDSIDFALALYPNNLELFCLSVLPGTDLHDAATGFGLEWESKPPYHVLKTPKFSPEDLKKADKLARAVNLFYTQGRAVPWFNSILYILNERASQFFKNFAEWYEHQETVGGSGKTDRTSGHGSRVDMSVDMEAVQLKYLQKKFHEKHLDRFWPAAEDLIKIHGALGRCTYDGTESSFTTTYHPDDVMSEYGTDIEFFTENAGKQRCKVQVFCGENGPDWRVVK